MEEIYWAGRWKFVENREKIEISNPDGQVTITFFKSAGDGIIKANRSEWCLTAKEMKDFVSVCEVFTNHITEILKEKEVYQVTEIRKIVLGEKTGKEG